MTFLYSLFYTIDMFKIPIHFSFNSKPKIPTKWSFFLSVLIYIFLCIFFFQSDLFTKTAPISSIQSISVPGRPKLQFDFNNMSLALGLSDDGNNFYNDPTIFTLKLLHIYMNVSGEIIYQEEKELDYCEEKNFPNQKQGFKNLELAKAFCPKRGNFTLEGDWDEPFIKYLSIDVYKCQNSTENNNSCKSEDEIAAFFSFKYLSLYFSDNIIDVTDYENPVKSNYRCVYYLMDLNLSKQISLEFKKVQLTTDDGVIFQNDKPVDAFVSGKLEVDYYSKSYSVCTWAIYSSQEIQVVRRRYQKLQEAIANLGGLANSLFFVGYLLTFLEKEFFMFQKIINQIYVFPQDIRPKMGEEHMLNTRKINVGGNLKISARSMQDGSSSNRYSTKRLQKFRGIIRRFFSEKTGLYFSLYEFLKIKLGLGFIFLTPREKILKKSFQIYHQQFDIIHLIRKINEIDKLKVILFNSHQARLFNLLAKPEILLEKKRLESSKSYQMSLQLENLTDKSALRDIENYYLKIKEKGEKASEVDQRLINLLNF